MSLLSALSTLPGTFFYHLLILLVLEAMTIVALVGWQHTRDPDHLRRLGAFAGLLAVRALLLLGEPTGAATVAPLVSGAETAALSLLGWAFVTPLLSHLTRRGYLVAGLGVPLVCTILFLPGWHRALAQAAHFSYVTFWQQTFWYALSVLLSLAPTLILLRYPHPQTRWLTISGFLALTVGFTTLGIGASAPAHVQLSAAPSTLIGLGRLINLLSYPLLAGAIYRAALRDMRADRQTLQDASEQAARQAQELQVLVETSQVTTESLDLDTVLRRGLENAAMALGAERAGVLLVDPDQPGMINLVARYAPSRAEQRVARSMFALAQQPMLAYALRRRRRLVVNTDTDNPHLQAVYELLGSSETGPIIVQPLLCQHRVLGALVLGNDRSQRTFRTGEGRLCQHIAAHMATAIQNARLYQDREVHVRQLSGLLQSSEQEIQRHVAILGSIAAGVVVTDKEGHIVAANAAAERTLGVSREHILDHSLERLAAQVALNPQADWCALTQCEGPLQVALELESGVIRIDAAPVVTPAGDHLGTVALLRDVTPETEAEKARSEFITAISQGLRSPLTSIRGYAEALSSGMVGSVSEAQSHFLKIIRDNALRMAGLIENLVAASQIERGFLTLEYGEIDLHLLISDVLRSFEGELEARQLEINMEVDDRLPLIEADPARVRQILENLISNAIKFTYPGGHISVGVKTLRDNEGQPPTHCSIWVADTGIGISAEEQPHIWERFRRSADSLDTEASRLGVGLSIVRSLVEAHSGRVWVESTPGGGSTFTVLLPIKHAPSLGG